MNLVLIGLFYLGQLISSLIRLFHLGSGSTWPGELILRLYPRFTHDLVKKLKLKIVLIAGTNGKTTTASLIQHIFQQSKVSCIQNEEGANLMNGITTAIIRQAKIDVKLDQWCVFEVDENYLPVVLQQVKPHTLIILNLFRDQLDRYGETHIIAKKWSDAIKLISKETNLILNGEDPLIYRLGVKRNHTLCYGIDDHLKQLTKIPHDADSTYCPICNNLLTYNKISYSHLGNFHCEKCHFTNNDVIKYMSHQITYPLKGIYNIYNTNAVVLFFNKILDRKIDDINIGLNNFKPAFGRQEIIDFKEHRFMILLSKNPTGLNQSLKLVKSLDRFPTILFVLNDNIPDGRDVSWIWDADFEMIKYDYHKIYCSGLRAYDMAIRLRYTSLDPNISLYTNPDIDTSINRIIEKSKPEATIYVLTTYSGMLDVRKILVGHKLL